MSKSHFCEGMSEKGNKEKQNMEQETENIIKYKEIVNGFKLDDNLIVEADDIWIEVHGNEGYWIVETPSDLQEDILNTIREKEGERARVNLTDKDKELLQLGMIYEKKRKLKKYLILAAAMVMMLMFGITSVGEGDKIFEKVAEAVFGRQQNSVHSEDIVAETDVTEEEVFQEIEDKYGVLPVRMMYYPEGIALQEVVYLDDIQQVSIFYGTQDYIDIKYDIRPNYRASSWGQDMEDEQIDEYETIAKGVRFQVKQYMLSDGTLRWVIRYEYEDVAYSLTINRFDKTEVEKVIKNLYFS